MDKRFWSIVGVIILIFVGILWANSKKAGAPDGSANSNTSAQPTNHVQGKGTKNVTLVEYGDFQCPICALYYPTVKEVVAKYGDDVKFQFRNYPLTQIHPNALAGSRAAEAADVQKKYWEMHDLLYQNQQAWSQSSNPLSFFEQYAKSLSLDTAKFKTDFASDKVNNAVNADIQEGTKLKISGTPAFFINGKEIELKTLTEDNQPSVGKFSKVIDEAIANEAKAQ